MGSPAKGDYVGESPTLSSIDGRLKALAAKGWSLHFTMDWSCCWTISGEAGDCNCPYIKDYDPRDGHGYSYFSSDDNVWYDKETKSIKKNGKPTDFESFAAAVGYAETEINAIVPGSGKPPVIRTAAPPQQETKKKRRFWLW